MDSVFSATPIAGCFVYNSKAFYDQRGSFVKMYAKGIFAQQGLDVPVAEIFFSNSKAGVIRGMHFQKPPYDHSKIVTCLSGRILDVVLDLRKSSATFGKAEGFELSPQSGQILFIPRGCAHGFYSFEDNSLVAYAVETDHNKEADSGVLWSSFEFEWPKAEYILSERDLSFPKLKDFVSPFS